MAKVTGKRNGKRPPSKARKKPAKKPSKTSAKKKTGKKAKAKALTVRDPKKVLEGRRKFFLRQGGMHAIPEEVFIRTFHELEALESKHGKLTAEVIHEWAKGHPRSALHKCFEWDDKVAAELFRKYQARSVVGSVVLVPHEDSDMEVPYYLSTRTIAAPEKGPDRKEKAYVSLKNAVRQPYMVQDYLEGGVRRLRAFEKRFGNFRQFTRVVKAIRELEAVE